MDVCGSWMSSFSFFQKTKMDNDHNQQKMPVFCGLPMIDSVHVYMKLTLWLFVTVRYWKWPSSHWSPGSFPCFVNVYQRDPGETHPKAHLKNHPQTSDAAPAPRWGNDQHLCRLQGVFGLHLLPRPHLPRGPLGEHSWKGHVPLVFLNELSDLFRIAEIHVVIV